MISRLIKGLKARKSIRILSVLMIAGALYNPAYAEATDGESIGQVSEYTLDNGFKVLVKPDHRAPVVVSQVWYRIGSSFERTGHTGVSHVLEHMMFKGTDRFGPGELSNLVARYGGNENAFTGRDYTGYYQMWEKTRLPISLAIEANRMTMLNMDAEEFEKEKRVVMEERRMRTDDSPIGTAYERLFAAAFLSSPYQNPVIGWRHDLKNLSLEYTKKWYEKWYSPNNATLVVVGDVDPDEVHQLAIQHFGDLKAKTLPELPDYTEQESKGEKRITIKEKVKVPQLMMGFLTPSIKTAESIEDTYALAMLAYVLDGGLSARFETNLVRGQQVAASIGTGYDPIARGDVLFSIMSAPTQGTELDQLESAIFEQIQKIKETPPTADELQRALVQLKAGEVFGEDSVFNQADTLGRLAVIDEDWRLADEWIGYLEKVTPEDIQRVAQKYIDQDRMTLVSLVPEDEAPETAQAQSQQQGAVQ